MAELVYIVKVEHKEKGIGYSVKDALQNAQRQDSSPIKEARIIGVPSSSHTNIRVTIDDVVATAVIEQAIRKSGRLPSNGKLYPGINIELQNENVTAQEIYHDLQKTNGHTPLTRENSVVPKIEINTPLEGLLGYFSNTRYAPQVLFDNENDIEFAKLLFDGKRENTFVDYVNHALNKNLTQKEINKILREEVLNEEEIAEITSKYEIARKEVEYVINMKNNPEVPETLKEDIQRIVQQNGSIEIVRDYVHTMKEQSELIKLKNMLSEVKEKYQTFSDQVALLNEAGQEMPVIFSINSNSVDIYLPFRSQNINSDLVDEIAVELFSNFDGDSIHYLEGDFIGYKIRSSPSIAAGISKTIDNAPVALKLAGLKGIIPYVIGK
jgi:hypothetical protein